MSKTWKKSQRQKRRKRNRTKAQPHESAESKQAAQKQAQRASRQRKNKRNKAQMAEIRKLAMPREIPAINETVGEIEARIVVKTDSKEIKNLLYRVFSKFFGGGK